MLMQLFVVLQDVYFTIHVTPQEGCSWVSFETNAILNSTFSLIREVLATFQPGQAVVSVMSNKVIIVNRSSLPIDH